MTFLTKKPFSLGISLEDFSSILLPHGEDQYLKEKALLNRNLKGNYGIGGRSIQVLHHEVLKLHEELWKEEYRLFLSIETEIQLLLEEKLWDSKELYYEIDRNKGKLIDFNKIKVFFLKNNLDLKEKDFTLLIKRFSWEEKGLWITRDDFISLFNVKIIKANLKNRVTYPNFLTAQYELLKIKDLAEKHILQQKKNNLFHEPPFELKTKHCYIGNTKKIDLKYEKFIAKFQKTNYF